MPPPWRNPQVVTSAISGLLLAIGFFGGRLGLAAPLGTGLYVFAVIVGGWYFGREALEELVEEREIGIELLMSTAAIVAGLMGQWAEAAMLVFLYSISEAAEGYTEERTRNAIRALMDLAPKTALVIIDGKEVRLPVEEIRVGDRFIVHPGEAVATDGEIIDGRTSLDQSPVTGESVPVEKTVGDTVFAATLNGEGALVVRATKTSEDNTLARIIQLVEEASSQQRPQRALHRTFRQALQPRGARHWHLACDYSRLDGARLGGMACPRYGIYSRRRALRSGDIYSYYVSGCHRDGRPQRYPDQGRRTPGKSIPDPRRRLGQDRHADLGTAGGNRSRPVERSYGIRGTGDRGCT